MVVKAGDERRKKSRGAEAVVEDFDLDLTAVGVPGELELDPQFGGAQKGIGIVGKKDVGHIAADQPPDVREHLQALPAGRTLALIVHPNQVELRAAPGELRILLAEQTYARAMKQQIG